MARNSKLPGKYEDLLLTALADLAPDREPAAPVRQRLRQQLLGRIDEPRMHVVRAAEGQWRPLLPGVRIKSLRRDHREGSETTLWRLEPGAQVPAHPHQQQEECLILEGSVLEGGVEYFAGDYLLADVGLMHRTFFAPRGALLMIRSQLVPEFPALADDHQH